MASAASDTSGLTNLQFVTVETFIIQFIILLVVLWVLNKFIFKPYLAYLDEWEEKQKKVQEDYANADTLLEEKKQEAEQLLEDARTKGNSIILEAEELANTKRDTILMQTEIEVKEKQAFAESEIEKERLSMLSGVKDNIMATALKLNEKMFQNEKASKDFVEKHIDTL